MSMGLKRRIKLSQLQAYLAVMKHGGVTHASKQLHITQPAVSLSLKQLESSIGEPLLEMVNKKIYPTAAGEIVLQTCQTLDQLLDDLEANLSYLQGGVKGKLNLVMVSSAKFFIPQLLGDFLKLYPDIEPSLDFIPRQEVLEKLESNQCDFAVLSQYPKEASLTVKRFAQNPLVCIAAATHPLASKKTLHVSDLANENLVLREQGSGIRNSLEKLFKQHHVKPKVLMEFSSTEAIKQIVASGLAISLVPKLSIERELALKDLVVLNVEDTPIKKYWHIAYPRGKELSLIAKKFADYVHENISSVMDSV